MSSIYIQEPSTSGKVLLKTSFGELDIELWSREAPKACRNFVQLCMEGFYNGNIFHRVVKGFIAQTGDPTGTGTCNESIYGAPFRDEIHSRLRFVRRGLVACANAGKDDNGSQFFFTFAATPELQGKHTIFGKITGDTIYNLLNLEQQLVDQDDKPIYEQKIIKAVVLNNPFDDIIPRVSVKDKESGKSESNKGKKQERGVKNFKLLSFGDEAEEDEIETTMESKKFEGKSKSTHDILNDPKLSSKTIGDDKDTDGNDDEEESSEMDSKKYLEHVKNKLRSGKIREGPKPKPEPTGDYEFMSSRNEEKKRKLEEIKNEIKTLKREYRKEKKQKVEKEEEEKKEKVEKSEILSSYEKEQEKYRSMKKTTRLKGESREALNASFLKRIDEKLFKENDDSREDSDEQNNKTDNSAENWVKSRLVGHSSQTLAKDANTKSDDWYEIDIEDPRNPMNKRRRGETSKTQIEKKGKPKLHLL